MSSTVGEARNQLLARYIPQLVASLSPGLAFHVVLHPVLLPEVVVLEELFHNLRTGTKRDLRLVCVVAEPAQKKGHADWITVHTGSIQAELQQVVQQAGGLFVVDQGAMLPIAGVIDLAKRLGRTDMLLRYDHQIMQQGLSEAVDGELPHATVRALDGWYGSRHWREMLDSFDDLQQQQTALVDLYTQAFLKIGRSRLRWSAATPIYTSWGQLAYEWVFATTERNAGPHMSAALYAAYGAYHDTPEGYLNRATGGLPTQVGLFDAHPPSGTSLQAEKNINLVAAIRDVCDTQPRLWSYGDLRDHVLKTGWFGRCSETQFQAACRTLEQAGRLQRRDPEATWQRRTLLRLS